MDRFGLSQQIKASPKNPLPYTAPLSPQGGSAAHRHLHTEHRPAPLPSALLPGGQLCPISTRFCLGHYPAREAELKCILELMEGGVILSYLGSELEIALPMSGKESALIKVRGAGNTSLLCEGPWQ